MMPLYWTMLARGTSPIIIVPALLFLLCFTAYFYVASHWAIVLLAFLFMALSIMGVMFFRDPQRTIGKGVVSAADGVISFVRRKGGKVTISVFMNVHNVHVNRAPLDGKVTDVKHVPGGHVPAYKEISKDNEHFITDMETGLGSVRVIQIAGTVARRIIPYIKKGASLSKGQRIGIIRLGSRVDVVLPAKGLKVKVRKGQKVYAGTTTIARVVKDEGPRRPAKAR